MKIAGLFSGEYPSVTWTTSAPDKQGAGGMRPPGMVLSQSAARGRHSSGALVGFQGRGCADGVQLNCCHPFLLEALLFQWPSIRRCASRTMVEHKSLESHKSVNGYRYSGPTTFLAISRSRYYSWSSH